MAFVGQTSDPWDVPIKQSVEVMQKIWDATSGNEFEITTSTAIYHKVGVEFNSRMTLIKIYFQTVQRLADSWRNVIGSNGIAVLMAFFDARKNLRNSDEERINFAKFYLENFRFLYKDPSDKNKKVCDPEHDPT